MAFRDTTSNNYRRTNIEKCHGKQKTSCPPGKASYDAVVIQPEHGHHTAHDTTYKQEVDAEEVKTRYEDQVGTESECLPNSKDAVIEYWD